MTRSVIWHLLLKEKALGRISSIKAKLKASPSGEAVTEGDWWGGDTKSISTINWNFAAGCTIKNAVIYAGRQRTYPKGCRSPYGLLADPYISHQYSGERVGGDKQNCGALQGMSLTTRRRRRNLKSINCPRQLIQQHLPKANISSAKGGFHQNRRFWFHRAIGTISFWNILLSPLSRLQLNINYAIIY